MAYRRAKRDYWEETKKAMWQFLRGRNSDSTSPTKKHSTDNHATVHAGIFSLIFIMEQWNCLLKRKDHQSNRMRPDELLLSHYRVIKGKQLLLIDNQVSNNQKWNDGKIVYIIN
jgi:hypothetical protein